MNKKENLKRLKAGRKQIILVKESESRVGGCCDYLLDGIELIEKIIRDLPEGEE